MRGNRRITIAGAAILAVACAGDTGGVGGRSAREEAARQVTELTDAYVAGYFRAFPQDASLFGAPGADHRHLPDNSLAALEAWHAREDGWLARLREIDPAAVQGMPQAVTYGFLRNQLESSVGFRTCRMELWNVSPTWTGWQSEFALLASVQPVGSTEARARAVERLSELPRYLDTEIRNLRRGLARGFSEPRNNVRAVIDQMDALLEAPLSESPFVAMAGDSLPEFRSRLERLEAIGIRPAIRRYRDFLRDEYLPAARTRVGVDANPGGAECYRAAVRYHATVDLSAREIHETGLRQMEKVLEEMKAIGRRSFGTDDVHVLLERLRSDPRYLFHTRGEIVEYAEAAVERARQAVPRWFGRVPSARVVVRPYPEFQEKSAPGGFYSQAAADGSRPGIYLINTYQPEKQSRAGVESTAFHETYPGHHLQNSIAMERTDLHPISRYFFLSGFGEGWALYSERLADEMGLYSSDVDRLGFLSGDAHRAGRLVVDAGMHALGWTRRRAIDYLLNNTALSEAQAASEVDRYIAVPGQATAYMLGNLEIRRLREMAERELGSKFDIREFHDRVLEDGSVPLSMLTRKIEGWIEEMR